MSQFLLPAAWRFISESFKNNKTKKVRNIQNFRAEDGLNQGCFLLEAANWESFLQMHTWMTPLRGGDGFAESFRDQSSSYNHGCVLNTRTAKEEVNALTAGQTSNEVAGWSTLC